MNVMEILTLLLVIFSALSYIDNRNNKKNSEDLRPRRLLYSYITSVPLILNISILGKAAIGALTISPLISWLLLSQRP